VPPLRPQPIVAQDVAALNELAAAFLAERAADAVDARGRFVVALAGGSTPTGLYALLATPAWRARVPWERVHVFWGDERLVPPDDPHSNFGMAQQALLRHVAVPPEQVHRVPLELGAGDAVAARYESELRACFTPATDDVPRLDLVLLGLGSDGHTASLFPASPALAEQRRLVVATPPGALPPRVDRVTCTLPLSNAARAVAFLVTGADKAAPLRRVLAGDFTLPAARIRPTHGELRWFVDAAAMGEQ
jgi:6-phosphogluconolactonase